MNNENWEIEKPAEFYKKFYDDHRAALLQYRNLRKHFSHMIEVILGKDYYNMEMDVYNCDEKICEDIIEECRRWWWSKKRK